MLNIKNINYMIGFFRNTLTTNKKEEPVYLNRFSHDLCLSPDVSLTGCSSAEPVSVSIRHHKGMNLSKLNLNLSKKYCCIKFTINFVNFFLDGSRHVSIFSMVIFIVKLLLYLRHIRVSATTS